jgi:hypothetical protein
MMLCFARSNGDTVYTYYFCNNDYSLNVEMYYVDFTFLSVRLSVCPFRFPHDILRRNGGILMKLACDNWYMYKSLSQVRCSTNSVHIQWGCCNLIGCMLSAYLLKEWWDFDETCLWYLVYKVLCSSSMFDKFRAYLMRQLQNDWLNIFRMISSEGMKGFWWNLLVIFSYLSNFVHI